MKKLETKKRYVLPGDFITTAPLRLRDNVVLEGKRIISTTIGLSDISDDSARVLSLTGIYLPKIDDLVIGTIKSVSGNSWFADINSCYQGMLLGQDVIVKFSAYDYAIYGGLKGNLEYISADTIVDKDESYYLIKVRTDANHLETDKERLEIIPGMTASVNIVTGKKTVLDYLLKPVLRAKHNSMHER